MFELKEICCKFGRHRHLSGILTRPMVSGRNSAVVFVSAGLVPKFGPYRLYVELARCMARIGFHAFRFDLGGIGDSLPKDKNLPLISRTRLEIASALDYLSQHHGIHEFILAGLCSGAEDSFRQAENDHRVKGVILMDPFCYRTPGFQWRFLIHRLSRRSMRALGMYRPANLNHRKSLIDYKHMEYEESSRILQKLIDRQVRIHFIYTGGKLESFNHQGQLKAMFKGIDFKGLVAVDHIPQMNHTQVLRKDRDLLSEAIHQRLK